MTVEQNEISLIRQGEFPSRKGERPVTQHAMPHTQLSQNAPPEQYSKLTELIFSIPGIEERRSLVSVPGARALWLREGSGEGPRAAFFAGREFAHLHPAYDGSLHMTLPQPLIEEVTGKGCGELHPLAEMGIAPGNFVMIYGPRNDEELKVVYSLVRYSCSFAKGEMDKVSATVE